MNRIHPRDRRNVILLSLLLAAAYYPAIWAWARGGWAFGEDAPGLFAPWRAFAGSEIRAGRWPLWNPWLFGGLPFALNGQAALAYPPNILFWLLPIKTALLIDAVAHSILLGAGAYFLGRALGLSRTASWMLALCLGANGGVASHVYAGHVTWHAARAWIPWMLWALVRGMRTRRLRYAYALALLFFLQLAAGYPPLALAGAGLCAGAFALHLAIGWPEPESEPELSAQARPDSSSRMWAWRWGAVAGLLAAGLAAGLALPLRELSGLSVHGSGLPWDKASELSGSWKSLARWIAPGVFDMARPLQWSIRYGAQEEASSIGIAPTLLALGAPLWARKIATRRQVLALWILWIAMVGCVVLSLGSNTPLYRALYDHVGLFRVLRFPVRWLEPWSILASAAAAIVFDAWYKAWRGSWRRDPRSAHLKYLQRSEALDSLPPRLRLASAVAAGVAACALGASCWLASRGLEEFWRPLLLSVDPLNAPSSQVRLAERLRLVAWSECAWAAILSLAAASIAFFASRAPSSGTFDASIASSTWGARTRRFVSSPWILALALVAAELGSLFVRSQKTWVIAPPDQDYPAIPDSISSRYASGERWATDVHWIAMDGVMASRIEIFNGYDAMNTRAFWSLAQAVEGRDAWIDMYQPRRRGEALRIAGVTHLLEDARLARPKPPGARLVASERAWRLWRLHEPRDVWPRFFLTLRARLVPEPDLPRALAIMARVPAPARGQAWPLLLTQDAQTIPDASTWAGSSGEKSNEDLGAVGRVLSWSARPNVLQCDVQSKRACWLGISQAWSPSWRAWIDGKPAAMRRANGPFCAVWVPAGRSRVRLAYAPSAWRLGSFATLCALAALGAGASAFWARRAPST